METAFVVVLVIFAHIVVIHLILRKFGIGTHGGKPDCGCGHCHTKRKGKAL